MTFLAENSSCQADKITCPLDNFFIFLSNLINTRTISVRLIDIVRVLYMSVVHCPPKQQDPVFLIYSYMYMNSFQEKLFMFLNSGKIIFEISFVENQTRSITDRLKTYCLIFVFMYRLKNHNLCIKTKFIPIEMMHIKKNYKNMLKNINFKRIWTAFILNFNKIKN